MKAETLQDLYLEQLRDLYDAENQLIKALPKMAKAASTPKLRKAFEDHLEQTREQAQRIETIFEGMGEKTKGQKCKAMEASLTDPLADLRLNVWPQPIVHYIHCL